MVEENLPCVGNRQLASAFTFYFDLVGFGYVAESRDVKDEAGADELTIKHSGNPVAGFGTRQWRHGAKNLVCEGIVSRAQDSEWPQRTVFLYD